MSKLHCYRREGDRKWEWRLTADNGEIVAVSGNQGYENYPECQAMADKVVVHAGFKDAKRTKDPED